MDPIRPITPHERDLEPVWRIDRADRDAPQKRRGEPEEKGREQPRPQPDPAPDAPPPAPDDDEPPHLIDVVV